MQRMPPSLQPLSRLAPRVGLAPSPLELLARSSKMEDSPAAQLDATSTSTSTSTGLRAEAAVFVPSAVSVQPWIACGWHNGSGHEPSRLEVDRRRPPNLKRSKFRGRAVCPTSYLSEDGELFASERQGFMAAGALLWRRDSSGTAVALMVLQHGHGRRPSSCRAGQVRLEALPLALRSRAIWATLPLSSLSDGI